MLIDYIPGYRTVYQLDNTRVVEVYYSSNNTTVKI